MARSPPAAVTDHERAPPSSPAAGQLNQSVEHSNITNTNPDRLLRRAEFSHTGGQRVDAVEVGMAQWRAQDLHAELGELTALERVQLINELVAEARRRLADLQREHHIRLPRERSAKPAGDRDRGLRHEQGSAFNGRGVV